MSIRLPIPFGHRWARLTLALVPLAVALLAGLDGAFAHHDGVGLRSAVWQGTVAIVAGGFAQLALAVVLLALLGAFLRMVFRGPDGVVPRAILAGAVGTSVVAPWLIVHLHASTFYDPLRLATQRRLDFALGLTLLLLLTLGAIWTRTVWARIRPRTLWGVALGMWALSGAVALAVHAQSRSHLDPAGKGRNVVLIVFDALRRDALGTAGNPLADTPTMDELASEGLWLGGLVANGPTSVPGHASLLTGRGVQEHRAFDNTRTLPSDVPTLAEAFRRRGYRTAGVCRNQLISAESGFDRGFDSWWNTESLPRGDIPARMAVLRVPLIRLALKLRPVDLTTLYGSCYLRPSDRPFFLFLQYLTCHEPYEDRYGWATAERVDAVLERYRSGQWSNTTDYPDREVAEFHARYLGAAHTADIIVKRLLELLRQRGLAESTAVIITADHGETLAEHGSARIGHHGGPFESSLRIPLIARVPGSGLRGVRYRGLSGQDRVEALALAVADPSVDLSDPAVLEATLHKRTHFAFAMNQFVLYDDSLKIVVDRGHPEMPALVYRWRTDPGDRFALQLPEGVVATRREELEELLERDGVRESLARPVEVSPQRLRALRALGYVE